MAQIQVHLADDQQRRLKQRAKEIGVSEEEFIRRLIAGALANGTNGLESANRQETLEEFFRAAGEIAGAHNPAYGSHFQREDAYEEREARFGAE